MPRKVYHANVIGLPVSPTNAFPQNKTPVAKIRLRDNQRRSRARQREYVEDLQQRLREHEQRGVQATLDMQRAARAVALENNRLRALLAHHGVSDDEVERFLRSESVAPSVETQRISLPPHSHTQRRSGDDSSIDVASVLQQESTMSDDDSQDPPAYYGGDDAHASAIIHEGPTSPPPASAPDDTRTSVCLTISSMETSCDTAATIIANVQGHGDKALAFSALGCSGTRDCVVKNIEIFNLIDQAT